MMTLGSLFDGSGGFPLAGVLNGITPVWASEIEPYPLKVTAVRFPHMKQYGDITQMHGYDIEPVDIISFGSPCQDLSVAGKQAGLHDGERSSLFFHAIRIIKEMREATNGKYPRFAVWENVPGAFSSNNKRDFAAVLEALASVCEDGVSVPVPEKWKHAGCVVGDGWSIAWRLYDAQYWGVPQRRKRIYLIGDFGSERAGEILFESESVSGNPAQGTEKREGSAGDTAESIGETGNGRITIPVNTMVATRDNAEKRTTFGVGNPDDPQFTISAAHEHAVLTEQQPIVLEGNGSRPSHKGDGYKESDTMYTLNTTEQHAVAYGLDRASFNQGINAQYDFSVDENLSAAMVARGPNAVCVGNGQTNQSVSDKAGTLNCMHDQQAILLQTDEPTYIVRRLTPLECCRLQGFPDWWEEGVQGSDTSRYKMWGNGIALPCARDVLRRIVKEMEQSYA